MNLDYVGLGIALIGTVVWFARLESRIKSAEHEIARLEKELDVLIVKHEALDNRVLDELSKVRESLARIEGAMSIPVKKERK
jgi:hypothetical protein